MKNEDIRKTGIQGLKGINSTYNDDDDLRISELLEEGRRIRGTSTSNYLPAYKGDIGLAAGSIGYGESKYDSDIDLTQLVTGRQDIDLQDTRYLNQSTIDKWGNGLAKGIARTGTSFLNGTVGVLWGIGTAITEGRWSGLWDNSFGRAMDAVDEVMESNFTNYRSQYQRENPMSWDNLTSASFWADAASNLGFVLGSSLAASASIGAIARGVGAIGKGLGVAKATKSAADAAKHGLKLSKHRGLRNLAAGSIPTSIGEAGMEARSIAKEFEHEAQELDKQYQITQESIIQQFMLDNPELRVLATPKQGSESGEVQLHDSKGNPINLSMDAYKAKLIDENPELRAKLKEAENTYLEAQDKLSENRTLAGNVTFGVQLPVLMGQSIFQFGKLWKHGFSPGRQLPKYGIKTAIARGTVGQAASEGLEEMWQSAAGKVGMDLYGNKALEFYLTGEDPTAQYDIGDFISTVFEQAGKTLVDPEALSEGVVGAAMGLVGGAGVTRVKNKSGGSRMALRWNGGIWSLPSDIKAIKQRKEIELQLEQNRQSGKFDQYYKNLTRQLHYEKQKENAEDEVDFEKAEYNQLISDVAMHQALGTMKEYRAAVEVAVDTSESGIMDIIESATQLDEDGNIVDSPFKDKYGQIIDHTTASGRQQITQQIEQNRADILQTIDDYTNISAWIDMQTGHSLELGELQSLTFLKANEEQWGNKAVEAHGNIDKYLQETVKPRFTQILEDTQNDIDTINQLEETDDTIKEYLDKLNSNKEYIEALLNFIDRFSKTTSNKTDSKASKTSLLSFMENHRMRGIINDLLNKEVKQEQENKDTEESKESGKYKEGVNPVTTGLNLILDTYEKLSEVKDTDAGKDISNRSIYEEVNRLDKFSKAAVEFNNTLHGYLNGSKSLRDDLAEAKVNADKANRKVKTEAKIKGNKKKLSEATSLSEFHEIYTGIGDEAASMQTLMDLAEEDSPVGELARQYKERVSSRDSIIQNIGESNVETSNLQQAQEDALNMLYELAQDYDKYPNLLDIKDFSDLRLPENSTQGLTEEEIENRKQAALTVLQNAIDNTKKSKRERDKATTESEVKAEVEEEVVKETETEVVEEIDTSEVTDDNDTQEAEEIEEEPVIQTEEEYENTNKEVEERDKEKSKGSTTTIGDGEMRSGIPQFAIEGLSGRSPKEPGERIYIPFYKGTTNNESNSGYTGIYNYLDSKGAFKFVNEGNLEIGEDVYFIIDPSTDSAGHFWAGQKAGRPPIFMAVKRGNDYQIIGTPNTKDKGVESTLNGIYGEYSNHTSDSQFVSSRYSTTIKSTRDNGFRYTEKTDNISKENNLNGLIEKHNNTPIGKKLPAGIGVVKEGNIETYLDTDNIITTNNPLTEGMPVLLIPGLDGNYYVQGLNIMPFNKESFDILDPKVRKNPLAANIFKAIETFAKNPNKENSDTILWTELSKYLYLKGAGVKINKKTILREKYLNLKREDGTQHNILLPNNLDNNKVESIISDITNFLYSSNLLFQIDLNTIRDKFEGKKYADYLINDADILTTNMESLTPIGGEFRTNTVSEHIKETHTKEELDTTKSNKETKDEDGTISTNSALSEVKQSDNPDIVEHSSPEELENRATEASDAAQVVPKRTKENTTKTTGSKSSGVYVNSIPRHIYDSMQEASDFSKDMGSEILEAIDNLTVAIKQEPKKSILPKVNKQAKREKAIKILNAYNNLNELISESVFPSTSEGDIVYYGLDEINKLNQEAKRWLRKNNFDIVDFRSNDVGTLNGDSNKYHSIIIKTSQDITPGFGYENLSSKSALVYRDKTGKEEIIQRGEQVVYISEFDIDASPEQLLNDISNSKKDRGDTRKFIDVAAELYEEALGLFSNMESKSVGGQEVINNGRKMIESLLDKFKKIAGEMQARDNFNDLLAQWGVTDDINQEHDIQITKIEKVDKISREELADLFTPTNTKKKKPKLRTTSTIRANEVVKKMNKSEELNWLQTALPQLSTSDRLQFTEGLIHVAEQGQEAWGMFDGAMMVISDEAASGTLYHEAFHSVFNLLLTESERDTLIQEARKKYGEELTTRDIEELLAEEFREYAERRASNMINREDNLPTKIRKFFSNLFSKVSNWFRFRPYARSYFNSIYSGEFANRDIQQSTLTSMPSSSTVDYTSLDTNNKTILEGSNISQEVFDRLSPALQEQVIHCL